MQPDLHIQQLIELLQKPATVSEAQLPVLNDLAERYPYFKPLHLLLAKAGQQLPEHEHRLAKASLYNGGAIVQALMTRPETLQSFVTFRGKTSPEELLPESTAPQEAPAIIETDEQETFEEIAEVEPTAYVVADDEQATDTAHALMPDTADEQLQDIATADDVFEEISEIDTGIYRSLSDVHENAAPVAEVSPADDAAEVPVEADEPVPDFFAFEKNFQPEPAKDEIKEREMTVWQPEEYSLEAEAQSTVSKYDDDKLPYTFLWWLAKTRKEHAQIFQPYVSEKKQAQPQTGELQQQYIEHIFHLQTPFDLEEETKKGHTSAPYKPRGSDIIDNFIKNEPQIKTPKAEQINTENKAKKSAEDHYDLVSETLASIYIEQMLYHKAIDTYQKLSLKFPEKSRYFADLIQSLEKKI